MPILSSLVWFKLYSIKLLNFESKPTKPNQKRWNQSSGVCKPMDDVTLIQSIFIYSQYMGYAHTRFTSEVISCAFILKSREPELGCRWRFVLKTDIWHQHRLRGKIIPRQQGWAPGWGIIICLVAYAKRLSVNPPVYFPAGGMENAACLTLWCVYRLLVQQCKLQRKEKETHGPPPKKKK